MRLGSILIISMLISCGLSAEEAAEPGGGADREWAKRTNKLNVYEQNMKDLTAKIQNFIRANDQGVIIKDEKGQPVDTLQAMVEHHRQLKKTVADYNKEKAELKYRYPEEGSLIDRRYMPAREQSIEEIAKDMGINADLRRLKAKIDQKYEPIVGEKPKPVPQRQKSPQTTLQETKTEKPERLRLVK